MLQWLLYGGMLSNLVQGYNCFQTHFLYFQCQHLLAFESIHLMGKEYKYWILSFVLELFSINIFFAASNHTIPKYGQKHIDFIDGIIKRDRQKHMQLWTLQMKPDEPPEIQGPGRLGFLHQNDICLKKLWSHYSWRFFLSWPGWRHRRGGRWRRRWCRRGSTWQGLSTLLSLRGSLQGLSWTGSPTPGSGIRWMRF